MRKLLFLGIMISAVVFWLGKTSPIFENMWGQITDSNYIIPDESSLLRFNATKMNQGSGDWWLYGEDGNYYYSTETGEQNFSYIKVAKNEVSRFKNFDPYHSETWRKSRFQHYESISQDLETIYVKNIQWAATDRPNWILVKDYEKHKNDDNLVDYCFYIDHANEMPIEMVKLLEEGLSVSISGKFYKTKQFDEVFPYKGFGVYSFVPQGGFSKVFVFDATMSR